ncbi:hypothetical protein D3C78_1599720 [compost metagenome]
MGVRISWLILARNWDLAWVACSATASAACNSCVRLSTCSSSSMLSSRMRFSAAFWAVMSRLMPTI